MLMIFKDFSQKVEDETKWLLLAVGSMRRDAGRRIEKGPHLGSQNFILRLNQHELHTILT